MTASAGGAGADPTWNLASDIAQVLSFHFMVNAFRAGAIAAVAAGAIGWFMVLRGQSFVGHSLAMVGFPGASGAVWLGLSASVGYFGFCGAAAVIIAFLPRRGGVRGFSEESALIGTLQALALASGFLFVGLYKGFLDGITSLLFGSFIGITDHQVVVLAAVAVVALITLGAVGRPLLFASIDPDVAAARGVPVGALSAAFLLLLGIATAEVSQITGTLLVFALLVMPAAAARQLTTRPALSFTLTVVMALVVTWGALAVAYYSVYPVGFFVTTFGFVLYVAATGWRLARGRRWRRTTALAVAQ